MSRLRCSEGGFGLWLGDKGIANGKTSTSTYILTTCILGRETVGWSAAEVWYLGIDYVYVGGLLNQKISTILYLLYVVYLVYRL
jgi:hypothetical protein